jgi:hypothetical protein
MTTTTVNDALVKLDNIITAANYLLEEIQTRKDSLVNSESVKATVKEQMNTREFLDDISYYVRNNYSSNIYKDVAFHVMTQIDADIEAFINDRVKKALEQQTAENTNQD